MPPGQPKGQNWSLRERFVTTIPARYEWDKAAIKLAAKAGEPLPEGVTVSQSVGLRIR